MSFSAHEQLDILLKKIMDLKEENKALKAELSALSGMEKSVKKSSKKEKKQQSKDMTPSLF